jgi:ketopantoate reductase
VARAEGGRLTDETVTSVVDQLATMPTHMGSSIPIEGWAGRALEWEARKPGVRRLGARHGTPT